MKLESVFLMVMLILNSWWIGGLRIRLDAVEERISELKREINNGESND